MNHNLHSIWNLKQEPVGPLTCHLYSFETQLIQQGFCRQYIGSQLRIVAGFSKWMDQKKIPIRTLSEKHTTEFICAKKSRKETKRGNHATLRRLIVYLREQGICQNQTRREKHTQIDEMVERFGQYLVNERNLSPKTHIQYGPIIDRFLSQKFPSKKVNLTKLSGKDIIEFVAQEAARLSVARAKVTTNALRSFIRYGVHRGEMSIKLVSSVPTVASWTMGQIPRAISTSDIQAILSRCPRDTVIGCRDYAILLLLVHLGLRSGEIVSLTLDSIDWEAGSITVVGKLGRSTALPLPAEVGAAISEYLQLTRPTVKTRALFLRTLAPIGPLGAQQTIATIVNTAIKRAGISPPTHGAHQFRHALATTMLKQGASLTEIGSILRHEHQKTTNIYAKVDIEALRELSQPWPGVVS